MFCYKIGIPNSHLTTCSDSGVPGVLLLRMNIIRTVLSVPIFPCSLSFTTCRTCKWLIQTWPNTCNKIVTAAETHVCPHCPHCDVNTKHMSAPRCDGKGYRGCSVDGIRCQTGMKGIADCIDKLGKGQAFKVVGTVRNRSKHAQRGKKRCASVSSLAQAILRKQLRI